MDFEFLKTVAPLINKEINKLLVAWKKEVGGINTGLLPLVDKFIDSCQGGKRIRGALVVLGYQLGKVTTDYRLQTTAKAEDGRRKTVDIFKIAAAYEIFHSAILAHDDVMDQSLLRRGKPSLFKALGGDHYGISQAINLGDAGFFLSLKVIAESNFPDKEKNQAIGWFCQTMLDTGAGQMLDLAKQDPIMTAKLKTARYSMVGPLVLGAILGEGGQTLLKYLDQFAENLGIAFQIKDDILDLEVKVWGGEGLAKKAMEEYKDQALKVLPSITKDIKMRKILEQLAKYLIERKK